MSSTTNFSSFQSNSWQTAASVTTVEVATQGVIMAGAYIAHWNGSKITPKSLSQTIPIRKRMEHQHAEKITFRGELTLPV